jgi:undecaprenyl-diphosphatase
MADVCVRGVDTGFVALGYAKVAVLGVVQGITELLPISSTAHMRLVPGVLGWQDPGFGIFRRDAACSVGRCLKGTSNNDDFVVGSTAVAARRSFSLLIWRGCVSAFCGRCPFRALQADCTVMR